MQDVARADFQGDGKADALGSGGCLGDGRDCFAPRQGDAVTCQRRLQRGGRKIAGRSRPRHRRRATAARRVEPQAIERANRRLDSLQERKARNLLRRKLLIADLLDHAGESENRLVGLGKYLTQRRHVAPGVRTARHI